MHNIKTLAFTIALATIAPFAIAQKQDISLTDIWASAKLRAANIDGLNNMNDGEHYTVQEQENKHDVINKYNYKTGKKVATLLTSSTLVNPINKEEITFSDYAFDATETKLILTTNASQIYRHSFDAAYVVVDLKTNKVTLLDDVVKQQLPDFNPQSTAIAYVQKNNVYVKKLGYNVAQQITFDGKRNAIINGTTDWVYEEEFGFDRAFYWSNDGKKIAYYKFDESAVKEFNMTMFNGLYPSDNKFKYPKAGEKNSVVTIHIYDVEKGTTVKANIDISSYEYIPRIAWHPSGTLMVSTLNRAQNKLDIYNVNATSGAAKQWYTRTDDKYIDISEGQPNFFYPTADGKSVVMLSDEDGYIHLYKFDYATGAKTLITKGNFDIKKLHGIDDKNQRIYYSSTEVSPSEDHSYVIDFNGANKRKLTQTNGFNDVSFSANYNYFICTNSSFGKPYNVTLSETKTLKPMRVLENNAALNATMSSINTSSVEMINVKTVDGTVLNGYMIKPTNFNATTKYPVFQTYYGGPGKAEVESEWGGSNYWWHQFLAQKGYIVVCVDNRGTPNRGNEFKKATYKNLGKLEVEDQIEVAKYLGTLPYVDKNRIACMGWSFGGYLTALCMTKGADYFKAGIAVAPVTNWRYYDSIYTERFLLTPQDNAKGYDDNSPINFTDKMKGAFLLVHGSADDNVHVQNSMEMNTALVKSNKQFDQMIYTNKAHGISGGNTRLHLYTKMFDFLQKNL
jgi:dipeptidyl-peptidase 4